MAPKLGNDEIFAEISYRDGCLIGLGILPALFLFDWLADGAGVQNAATSSVAVLVIIVALFYPLTRHVWFWIVWLLLAVAHAAAIVMIDWPDELLSGVQLKGYIWVHLAVVGGSVWLIARVMRWRKH